MRRHLAKTDHFSPHRTPDNVQVQTGDLSINEGFEPAPGGRRRSIPGKPQGDVRLVGAIPVAHRVIVATPASGSRTDIEIADVRFNQGLKEDAFSQRYLELGRVD